MGCGELLLALKQRLRDMRDGQTLRLVLLSTDCGFATFDR